MTVYVDVSVIAAYYCPEPLSLVAERTLRSVAAPTISVLTLVEFASAVSRKIREKSLSRESGVRVMAQFEAHVEEGYYDVLSLKARDYRLAKSWLGQFQGTLRTLDALHLSAAEAAAASVLTADRRLATEARNLGLPVKPLVIGRVA
ncbi:MAG: type II toxin-antitoxin system VapC family toxin [Nitrospiraceae bacterium]